MDGQMKEFETRKRQLIHGYRMLYFKLYPSAIKPSNDDFAEVYWKMVEAANEPNITDDELELRTKGILGCLRARLMILSGQIH